MKLPMWKTRHPWIKILDVLIQCVEFGGFVALSDWMYGKLDKIRWERIDKHVWRSVYRGRIAHKICRSLQDEPLWCFSKVGNPLDWDYSPDIS